MADKVQATYQGPESCRAGGGDVGYCQLAPGHRGTHVLGRRASQPGEEDPPDT